MSIKTFTTVAVTALTMGVGSAMAQSEVPGGPGEVYYVPQRLARPPTVTNWPNLGKVQSGSPDIDAPRDRHVLPFDDDYTTLANPG